MLFCSQQYLTIHAYLSRYSLNSARTVGAKVQARAALCEYSRAKTQEMMYPASTDSLKLYTPGAQHSAGSTYRSGPRLQVSIIITPRQREADTRLAAVMSAMTVALHRLYSRVQRCMQTRVQYMTFVADTSCLFASFQTTDR